MSAAASALAGLLVVVVARPWRRRAPRRLGRGAVGTASRSTIGLDVGATRWLAVLVGVALGFVVGGPVVAVLAGAGCAVAGPVVRRVRRHRERAAVAAAVPDLVDLFLVSASAGQPVAGAMAVVAPRAPPAVAPAVSAAHLRFRRGQPLAACLADLGAELGPTGAPLADALRQAATAGVPLVPLLEGVAATARDQRRRRAQEIARRLPVTMLFPLVACILPAAVLLAVVPVLLVSVSSLRP